jgi:predicted unusual protein kinase regulating ubiquinone biosynthesis (AarF/ABC1/UbiB family)
VTSRTSKIVYSTMHAPVIAIDARAATVAACRRVPRRGAFAGASATKRSVPLGRASAAADGSEHGPCAAPTPLHRPSLVAPGGWARRRARAVSTSRGVSRGYGVEIFDDLVAVDGDADAPTKATSKRTGSRSGGYSGSRVEFFDDVPEAPTSSLSASPQARSAAAAALAKAEPLHELEDIIRVRGYDPKAIDEYFLNHPGQLLERAADVTSALTTIWWLLRKKDYENLVPTIERLGPTYVKFGQALASRGDLVGAELATALEKLQDDMEAAPIELARAIVAQECPRVLGVLDSGKAIAAASLSQVYKGTVAGRTVAVKVQRPGIAARVAADAALLRAAAKVLEFSAGRGFKAQAVAAVDEFASRIFEEMDFANEAANIRKFDALYGPNGTNRRALPAPGYVRVPGLIPSLPATRRVLVMEWLEGDSVISLVSPKAGEREAFEAAQIEAAASSGDDEDCVISWDEQVCNKRAASLPLIDLGIRCTLSQLIETGVMHADPHGGNLLRLQATGELAYLDFGLVSEVPPEVRDGLVAAVTLLIFSRDYQGVASLFGDLQLVPQDVIENPYQFASLVQSLREAADSALVFPEDELVDEKTLADETQEEARLRRAANAVPDVRFDQLLGALLALVPKYRFVLPPYFLNNARALGTLEGMARSADPNFNILRVVYPFAVKRLLANPTGSPVLRRVLRELVRDKKSKGWRGMSLTRLKYVVEDAAALTGVPRWHILRSTLRTKQGWRLALEACFSAVYWMMGHVMRVVLFVTGITPISMLYKKMVIFLSGGLQEEPVR